jgi:hypothetical protein
MQSIVIGLTQLCSLDKSVFSDDKIEITYLSKLLHCLVYFIRNSMAENGLLEIIGISQMISRLVSNFRLETLVQHSDVLSSFLQEFAAFTLRCLETLRKSQDMDLKTEIERSFDSLLEAWVLLLGENIIKNVSLQNFFKEISVKIFAEYVKTKMVVGSEELDEEELDDQLNDEGEQLNAASFLGRVDVMTSVQLLASLLKEKATKWETLVKTAKSQQSIGKI